MHLCLSRERGRRGAFTGWKGLLEALNAFIVFLIESDSLPQPQHTSHVSGYTIVLTG